jgi:hypothetical protein
VAAMLNPMALSQTLHMTLAEEEDGAEEKKR